jgi:hypothetical protein
MNERERRVKAMVKEETESVMMITEVFWGVTLCYCVTDLRRFKRPFRLHLQQLKKKAAGSFETSGI